MAKKFEFEKKLERLEEIVNLLDNSDVTLNEMIKLYEEGVKISKETREYLDEAEQKITDISKILDNEN
jgi:exodeoxyribonuclease VII small subunit